MRCVISGFLSPPFSILYGLVAPTTPIHGSSNSRRILMRKYTLPEPFCAFIKWPFFCMCLLCVKSSKKCFSGKKYVKDVAAGHNKCINNLRRGNEGV